MIELVMEKSIKPALTVLSYAYWIISEATPTGIVDKAFDQLFSLGLLCVVVFMLYREWKNANVYNQGRDERLEKLLSNNTVAMNNSTAAVKEFTDQQKRTNNELRNINERLEKIEEKQA